MAAMEAETRKPTSSFTPACDAHLLRKNSHARWKPVATNVVTHVQQTVAVAIWRLARHVVASAVPAAVAAAASPAPTRNTLETWEAASSKAAVGCLTRGTEDLTGGG